MKKAIRAIILALACVLALSCTKEDLLGVAIQGRWQLIKVEETIEGVKMEPEYFSAGSRTFWEFNPDHIFIRETENSLGFISVQGSWLMDGENVVVTTPDDGTIPYYVEKARLNDMILRDTYDDKLGQHHVAYLTFKK